MPHPTAMRLLAGSAALVAAASFARADALPSTLGTYTNAAGQSLTFGDPATQTATLTLNDGATLTNNGDWTAYAGVIAATSANVNVDPRITNNGTLTVNAGAGSLLIRGGQGNVDVIPLDFINTGAINVVTGTLNLAAPDLGDTGGTFAIAAGATLGLGDHYTFDAASTVTGAGSVLISPNVRTYADGPTQLGYLPENLAVAFNGAYAVTGNTTIEQYAVAFNTNATLQNLTARDSIISGTGTLTLAGAANLYGGTLSTAAVAIDGTLTTHIGSPGIPTFDGTAITVNPGGTLTFGIGQIPGIYFANHASLTNNGMLNFDLGTQMILSTFKSGDPLPGAVITNNGKIFSRISWSMSSAFEFDNNGTIDAFGNLLQLSAHGADSPDAVLNIHSGTKFLLTQGRNIGGTLNNDGTIMWTSSATYTLSDDLHFVNTGYVYLNPGNLILDAAQDPGTDGVFFFNTGTLTFGADYDFSHAGGPTLTGSGLIVVEPGVTLTVPIDTAFSGSIEVDGTLMLAGALDPADGIVSPQFTVLPAPEPGSLMLLGLALPLLLRRR